MSCQGSEYSPASLPTHRAFCASASRPSENATLVGSTNACSPSSQCDVAAFSAMLPLNIQRFDMRFVAAISKPLKLRWNAWLTSSDGDGIVNGSSKKRTAYDASPQLALPHGSVAEASIQSPFARPCRS